MRSPPERQEALSKEGKGHPSPHRRVTWLQHVTCVEINVVHRCSQYLSVDRKKWQFIKRGFWQKKIGAWPIGMLGKAICPDSSKGLDWSIAEEGGPALASTRGEGRRGPKDKVARGGWNHSIGG